MYKEYKIMGLNTGTNKKIISKPEGSNKNSSEKEKLINFFQPLYKFTHKFKQVNNEEEKEQTGGELLDTIFQVCDFYGVSDIQIRAGMPIYIETGKGMVPLSYLGRVSEYQANQILRALLGNQTENTSEYTSADPEQVKDPVGYGCNYLKNKKVIDFATNGISYGKNNKIPKDNQITKMSGRLRAQAHLSETGLGMTCRILNDNIPDIDTLGIDKIRLKLLKEAINKRAGLFLVTGPTGSGKSTTLAAIVDWARKNKSKHIVTVEDPIEYKYPMTMKKGDKTIAAPSIVTQQEVGRDIHTYKQGLKDALRKAPHIILLGEIRDEETIETCLEAAQTGHLVVSTLHTTGAINTIGRILEMFPEEKREGVVKRLSEQIVCIHSQGLLRATNGKKVLNYEFLYNTGDAVTASIGGYIESPSALKDCLTQVECIGWDEKLKEHLNANLITREVYNSTRLAKQDEED